MYCSTCGSALSPRMKFCNRCGAEVLASKLAEESGKRATEKRLDEYLDGLFWITVFGLAFVLGGMVALKKMDFSDWLIVAYVVVSSVAFLINLGLSLWQVYVMTRKPDEAKVVQQLETPDTNELAPASAQPVLAPVPSVTENTTHRLEHVSQEKATG